VKALLKEMFALQYKTKDENLLITGATFSPDENSETKKGLDAFVLTQVLQLDFDDSELDPTLASRLFADLKHVAYNSFNNGRDGLFRYRMFFPLSMPVNVEVYQLLWDMVAQRVVDAGYEVDKKRKGKVSGLDLSKRTPVAWMYAPCQANEKKHSFWIDHWDAPIIDPIKMIDRAPSEKPEYVEVAPIDNRSEAVKNLLNAIHAGRGNKVDILEEQSKIAARKTYMEKLGHRWLSEPNAGNMLSGMIPRWFAERGCSLSEIQDWYNEYFCMRPGHAAHKANWDKEVKKWAK
jgi:hypothetical protein